MEKKTKYQKQLKGNQKNTSNSGGGERSGSGSNINGNKITRRVNPIDRLKQREDGDLIDSKFGFNRYVEGSPRLGWLLNYLPMTIPDESGMEKSGIDMYFIDRNGENFKASLVYSPYFYIDAKDEKFNIELMQHLQKRFENCRVELKNLEDLDMPNHLSGKTHQFIKISFGTVAELVECKTILRSYIQANSNKHQQSELFDGIDDIHQVGKSNTTPSDPLGYIHDMRENDVPYSMRCGIDLNLRVGAWFIVTPVEGTRLCDVEWQKDVLELGEPKILAFDIECEKSPLKFPNSETDRIYMISYMWNQQGFLIVNREIVSQDIEDFEYTPSTKYPGIFQVFNVENEEMLLKKFIQHIQTLRPHVVVTYNGDFFDWPYVDNRCGKYNISLYKELGIRGNNNQNRTSNDKNDSEYTGRCIVHLDAFCWVKRDSYLPQGNQGLKSVTRCKLGYDPIEIDPEDMLKFAQERPDYMASYSVSDAVATYYLYNLYVHNFIFSLSTIIPMGPEEVLRKGSGTLCEALLMVEAFKGNIVCPNKDIDPPETFYNGHLLESETYIGGHVECLEAGIFRADITNKFKLVPSALQMLIDHIDRDLVFALEIENGIQRSEISNYDEIKQEIVSALEMLRDSPIREEMPLIYHLDVGAMYPNIILTNRLQPSGIVNQNICASCEFNQIENNCKRNMTWTWRGDYNPSSLSEYNSIKRQLAYEKIGDKQYSELSEKEQLSLAKLRLKQYSQRVYKKTKVTTTEERIHTVCMRENSFYVDTVRAFRDRRYDYKLLTKQWKSKRVAAEKSGDPVAKKYAEAKEILMDSLQVAHKCILNSFYGYVMRKGARWRSMEMAGIVTHTGAQLITQARILVEQVGRPLELDTDGIWCILPSSFPQDFKFKKKTGGVVHIEYPCAMLNADVHDRYTNHQYQDLQSNNNISNNNNTTTTTTTTINIPKYSTHSECSIFFELDGPYKAMILPASPEEGVLLKKKYVVFNFDNSIAELKGFELKRRGELELVKAFQSQVFEQFLNGSTLQECYDSVGKVGNLWLDVLDSKGKNMDDQELMELISERKTISKTLSEYEGRKATSLTTAQRLSDFLGAEMVKDKGLNCNLIISKYPSGAPVTERAIPVAIFQAETAIRTFFLRKWLQDSTIDCNDFREIVDWDYYKDRLGKTIQKIITIPAGMQKISNPCPRVEHPIWVKRILQEAHSTRKQSTILSLFSSKNDRKENNGKETIITDIEDFGSRRTNNNSKINVHIKKRVLIDENNEENNEENKNSDNEITTTTTTTTSTTSTTTTTTIPLTNIIKDCHIVKPLNFEKPKTLDELTKWLDERKKEWNRLRDEKKIRLRNTGNLRLSSRKYGLTTSEVIFGSKLVEDLSVKKKRIGIEDIVRNAANAVAHGIWQIIEFQETDNPGLYIAWSFTGLSQLQKLYINVPRIIYVNCRGGKAEVTAKELGGKIVKKDLPHGRPVYTLYEINLQEHKYIKNERALGLFLCDPLVEGVYETKTPLLYRTILRLGCLANVSKTNLDDGRDGLSPSSAFKLKDLKFVNLINQKYLEPDSASYKRIFIYHTEDIRRSGIGVLGLFIISENNTITTLSDNQPFTTKALIWIVQPRGIVDRPPMQRIFRRFCPDEKYSCKFTTNSVTSMNIAFSSCNEVLGNYIRERRGATIVVGQSIMDTKTWRKTIPVLYQFPFVCMPANSKDEKFPSIAWQIRICNIMVQRFLLFPQWFNDRLSCARYAHIPLGNLGRDVNLTMTDIIFGRQLEHNRQILWAAPGPLPDIGGAESDLYNVLSETLTTSIISEEGIYRGVCIEIEIFGFAVASIMSSGLLDAQGITTIPTVQNQTTNNTNNNNNNNNNNNTSDIRSVSLSNDAACARAFNLLKASVTKWIQDVGINGDLHADALLMSLYRYLCGSGQILLYDPSLYRVIQILMSKLFIRLISELKSLGCKIIYADYYRVIIATTRFEYSPAKEYAEFIIGALTERDYFQCLQMNIKKMWKQLIWLDSANWSGITLVDPELLPEDINLSSNEEDNLLDLDKITESSLKLKSKSNLKKNNQKEQEEQEEEYSDDGDEDNNSNENYNNNNNYNEYDFLDEINTDIENNTFHENNIENDNNNNNNGNEENLLEIQSKIDGSWDIISYLPAAAGTYLRHTIDQFLLIYEEQWQLVVEKQKENTLKNQFNSIDYKECQELVRNFMKDMIRHNLGPQLLHTMDVLLHRHTTNHSESNHQVALNFVKFITKILSLDPFLSEEISGLRRTLLTQLNMKEFNSQSEYEDPSPSYILRDVICSYCNTCRDLDLLRDPMLTGKIQTIKDSVYDNEKKQHPNWQCNHCGNSYDVIEVEQRLLIDLEKLITGYLIQDFRCSKTNLVSTKVCTSLSEYCAPLKMDIPLKELISQLQILYQVANIHQFEWLEEEIKIGLESYNKNSD